MELSYLIKWHQWHGEEKAGGGGVQRKGSPEWQGGVSQSYQYVYLTKQWKECVTFTVSIKRVTKHLQKISTLTKAIAFLFSIFTNSDEMTEH